MLASEFGVGYEDECLGVSLSYRPHIYDQPQRSARDRRVFRIELKTNDTSNQQSDLFPRHLYSEIAL
jgi:hypothetical protein